MCQSPYHLVHISTTNLPSVDSSVVVGWTMSPHEGRVLHQAMSPRHMDGNEFEGCDDMEVSVVGNVKGEFS